VGLNTTDDDTIVVCTQLIKYISLILYKQIAHDRMTVMPKINT